MMFCMYDFIISLAYNKLYFVNHVIPVTKPKLHRKFKNFDDNANNFYNIWVHSAFTYKKNCYKIILKIILTFYK